MDLWLLICQQWLSEKSDARLVTTMPPSRCRVLYFVQLWQGGRWLQNDDDDPETYSYRRGRWRWSWGGPSPSHELS